MEYFDALDLQTIPREGNRQVDELVLVASTLQLGEDLMHDKIKIDALTNLH